MSEFTFAQDVHTLKYIYGEQMGYLISKHQITIEQAREIMIKLGFEKGLDKQLQQED